MLLLLLSANFLSARFQYAINFAQGRELLGGVKYLYISASILGILFWLFLIVKLSRYFKKSISRKVQLWIFLIACIAFLRAELKFLKSAPTRHSQAIFAGFMARAEVETPKMLSDEIRIDSPRIDGNLLIMQYTVVAYPASELEPDYLLEQILPKVMTFTCDDEFAEHISRLNMTVRTIYKDKNDEVLFSVDKHSKDCPAHDD